jgi:hypothetical protein
MDHHQESNDSSHGTDEDGFECKETEGRTTIAKSETKNVGRLKVIVAFVLIASTIAVATVVYRYLSRNEETKFRDQFNDDGHKILASIGASLDKTFGMMDNLAVMIVANAKETNQTWPFVTLPNFGIRMAKLLLLTDIPVIGFLPVVTPHNRKEWEAYASEKDDWVNECVSVQKSWKWYRGPLDHHDKKIKNISVNGDVLPSNHRCVKYSVQVGLDPCPDSHDVILTYI